MNKIKAGWVYVNSKQRDWYNPYFKFKIFEVRGAKVVFGVIESQNHRYKTGYTYVTDTRSNLMKRADPCVEENFQLDLERMLNG